jgi:hypothetical protein
METWFLLTRQDSLSEARLKDKPEKYRYRPYPTCSEGVLFLPTIMRIGIPQAIGLPLSEQSRKLPCLDGNTQFVLENKSVSFDPLAYLYSALRELVGAKR